MNGTYVEKHLHRVVLEKQENLEHYRKDHPEWITEHGPVARFSDAALTAMARAAIGMLGGGRIKEITFESDLGVYVATYYLDEAERPPREQK